MTELRLDGLEADNMLAFLALLGLVRSLETARPDWRPRVRWSVEEPPLRPILSVRQDVNESTICDAAAEGLEMLASAHEFSGRKDLSHTVLQAREELSKARSTGDYHADLWSALASDVAVKVEQGKRLDRIEATPLCLLFGQGHQHFLDRLEIVPQTRSPPPRGRGKKAKPVGDAECLHEAIFQTWSYEDPTFSFRWDPVEDVRYALMHADPSVVANKGGTQHGANRLSAIGLSVATVVPVIRGGQVRLSVLGGARTDGFCFRWPIWRPELSLDAIRAVLSRDDLDDPIARSGMEVEWLMEAKRITVGKFMNFTRARPTG
jgi:hypothetical protein